MAEASGRTPSKDQGRRDVLRWLGLVAGAGTLAASVRLAIPDDGRPEEDLHRGLELHRKGQYEEAVDIFERVAEARPQNPLPRILTGSAFVNWDHFQEAASRFFKALELAPGNAVVHLYLGEAPLKIGREAKARRDFEVAMVLATEDKRVASAAAAHPRSQSTPSKPQTIER